MSFAVLEPIIDEFRNYQGGITSVPTEALLVDKAQLLTLGAPEMTVLVGGLRVLGVNARGSQHGVFTKSPRGADERLLPEPARHRHGVEATIGVKDASEGRDREDRRAEVDRHACPPVFGSNAQLRALAEVYGSADVGEKFVRAS